MQSVISNISIASCYIPILTLFWKKFRLEKSFILIAIYWLCSGLVNLPNWLSALQSASWQSHITLTYNLIDGPLILLFFLLSSTGTRRKLISYTMMGFVCFEIVIVALMGYNLRSSTIIIGLDTFIALTLCITNITAYLSKVDHSPSENALVFINSSILFSYGVFVIIYYFSYLEIGRTTKDENNEVFLIYYISLLLSSVLTCFGLWRYTNKTQFEKAYFNY